MFFLTDRMHSFFCQKCSYQGCTWKVLWNHTDGMQIQQRTCKSNNITLYKKYVCGCISSVLPEEQFEGGSLHGYLLIKMYLRTKKKYVYLRWNELLVLKRQSDCWVGTWNCIHFQVNNLGLKCSVMKKWLLYFQCSGICKRAIWNLNTSIFFSLL